MNICNILYLRSLLYRKKSPQFRISYLKDENFHSAVNAWKILSSSEHYGVRGVFVNQTQIDYDGEEEKTHIDLANIELMSSVAENIAWIKIILRKIGLLGLEQSGDIW